MSSTDTPTATLNAAIADLRAFVAIAVQTKGSAQDQALVKAKAAENRIRSLVTPSATRSIPDVETLLDNAACASQVHELLRNDEGEETVLREAVRMNVVEPLLKLLPSANMPIGEVVGHEAPGRALAPRPGGRYGTIVRRVREDRRRMPVPRVPEVRHLRRPGLLR